MSIRRRTIKTLIKANPDRSCSGKVRYPHKRAAEETASDCSERTGEIITAYPCAKCRGWHIGHPNLFSKFLESDSWEKFVK